MITGVIAGIRRFMRMPATLSSCRTIAARPVTSRNLKTPILIITNELDYRVPVGEGLQLFTAAQRMGVASKLIVFPDEGHWVLKPQNSEFWHKNVLGWLGKYLH